VSATLTACRVCGGARVETVLDFGDMPLANAYLASMDEPQQWFPLAVALCADCGCVQLTTTVPPATLFATYLYTSSTSGTLAAHFKAYARDTIEALHLDPQRDFVVGIGGNDGPLEAAFQALGFRVLNVEPARNIAELSRANRVPTMCAFFGEDAAQRIVMQHGQAGLITCNNCFAHMPDIHDVLRGVNTLLRPGGWFVSEEGYWLDAVRGNHFDRIYHEHVFYWTVRSLSALFRQHGLDINRVAHNDSQGGSIRVFVSRNGHAPSPSAVAAIAEEQAHSLFDPLTYAVWSERIGWWRDLAHKLLDPLRSLACYGVPAKFAMLSEQLQFTPERIAYAVDDSPIKVGRFTSGARILIVPRSRFVDDPPEHCIITAGNYADLIVASNPQFKGHWIALTPEPRRLS
jgi:SAM-dependent methyltransferase